MEKQIPKTLKWYVENDLSSLEGKKFQLLGNVYDIEYCWSDLETRDLIIRAYVCDLDMLGAMSYRDINYNSSVGVHDLEELIEGVNAVRTFPAMWSTQTI